MVSVNNKTTKVAYFSQCTVVLSGQNASYFICMLTYLLWPSRLGWQNTLTASVQRGKTPPNECPGYDSKQPDGEASVILEVWGNAEYPFIAIVPRSILARSGST